MRKIIIGSIIIGLILIIGPWIVSPIYNNYLSWRLEQGVRNLDSIDEYVVVEQHSFIGKLNGNGNGMSFMTSILLKTDTSIEEVELTLDLSILKSIYSIDHELLRPTDAKIETVYLEREDLIFDSLKGTDDYSEYIILNVFDSGYWGGLDVRGH